MLFEDDHSACEFILSYGPQIEVIEPEDLRAAVLDAAQATVALYRRRMMIRHEHRSFTWEMACRRRLARQHLLAPGPQAQLVETVRAVGGIQAQILSAAELAIGARVAAITRQDVQSALWEHHALVKTYGPRGTLHLLPADELPLWMAALRAAEALSGPPWYQRAELEPAQADDLLNAIGNALHGRALTRKELADEVTCAWVSGRASGCSPRGASFSRPPRLPGSSASAQAWGARCASSGRINGSGTGRSMIRARRSSSSVVATSRRMARHSPGCRPLVPAEARSGAWADSVPRHRVGGS